MESNDEMTPEWQQRFVRVEKSVEEIREAVVGKPEIGLTGLVKRMSNLEKKVGAIYLKMATVAGAGGVVIWLVNKIF